MKPRKLSKKDFVHALKNGLGSALLHVKQYTDSGFEKELVQACLTNYVYDRQTCNARGYWLAKILDHTNEIEIYAAAISEALIKATNKGKDFQQLIILATELFERGFGEFKGILMELELEVGLQGSSLGLSESLVDIASFKGFDTAVRKMMKSSDIENWEKRALFEYFSEEVLDSEEKAVAYIGGITEQDSCFAAYWADVKSEIADCEQTKAGPVVRPPVLLNQIIDSDDKCAKRDFQVGLHRRFGRTASVDELNLVLTRLETETDRVRLYNYVCIFWDRALPVVPQKILDLLRCDDRDLRRAARNALSLVQSTAVRKLALKYLRKNSDEDIVTGTWLLQNNFRTKDVDLLFEALRKTQDSDSRHWAASQAVQIAEAVNDTALTEIMTFVFATTPCDNCRAKALKKLADWNTASEQTLYEAQWDVSLLVRRTARNRAGIAHAHQAF